MGTSRVRWMVWCAAVTLLAGWERASAGGVQIKGTGQLDGDWGVWFVNGAHDIIVRHLRVRMGGNMKHDALVRRAAGPQPMRATARSKIDAILQQTG